MITRTKNKHGTKPKRILYVENGIGYGGAIICLRHLVRNLDRDRFEPMVVTGRTGPHYEEIAGEACWLHIPDRHLDTVSMRKRLDNARWPRYFPGSRLAAGQIIARADDLGNFLPFYLRLRKAARQFGADLIHANNEPLCNRAALLVGRNLGIPTVCHVRGPQEGSRLMQAAFRLPTHFVPVSHWVSRSIQDKLGVPPEKITVVYDGLELHKLNTGADGNAFRKRFGVNPENFAVGLVGLLIPWKGQEIFLDAAHMLRGRIPKLKMIIVGGTPKDCRPFEAMLRRRVKEERLEDTVIFTGHISDMPPLYNGLDVVVSASTSPEPLGTVVIESMAMGRPLVGPDHGGAAEMMNHEQTGLLFRPGDAEALARAIFRLYKDGALRRRLGRAARKTALSTFAVATHVEKIQEVYDRLFSKGAAHER